jgi:hypothetical protein
MNKRRNRPYPECNNHRLLCNARSGSLQADRVIRACQRKRDIGERAVGGRNIVEMAVGEMDIGENVATYRYTEPVLIHLQI